MCGIVLEVVVNHLVVVVVVAYIHFSPCPDGYFVHLSDSHVIVPFGSPLGPIVSLMSAVRGLIGFVANAFLYAAGPVCLSANRRLVACAL